MKTTNQTLKILYEKTNTIWILGPLDNSIAKLDLTTALSDVPEGTNIKIAPCAFKGCTSLTEVKMGPTVTFIGMDAFADCFALKTVAITAQLPAATLNNAPELIIEYGAFRGVAALTDLSLPFIGDTRKATVGNQYFGYIFGAPQPESQNKYIPANLTKVSFTGTIITQNEAGEETKYIDFNLYEKSFYGCSNLCEIHVVRPTWKTNSLVRIPDDCFNGCTALSYFGDAKTSQSNTIDLMSNDEPVEDADPFELVGSHIGERAFYNCKQIYKVNLSTLNIDLSTKGTPRIGVDAFKNCYNLVQVTGPGVNKLQHAELGSAFNGYLTYYAAEANSTPLGSINYDNDINTLALNNNIISFNCDSTVSKLTLPTSIAKDVYIKNYSFNAHQALSTVTFPSDTQRIFIGDSAFSDCPKLSTVSIPVTSSMYIGAQTFSNSPVKYINYTNEEPDPLEAAKLSAISWCKNITFGAWPQLFSSDTESVNFFETLSNNVVSVDSGASDIFTIPAFAFYNLQVKDKEYELQLTSSNSCKLLIETGAFANSNVKLGLNGNLDIADIKPGAFTNHTASFNHVAGSVSPAQSTVVLDYYTLGSWLTRVDWPSTFESNLFVDSPNLQIICRIPGHIKHICADVFKDITLQAGELYNNLNIPITFKVEYANDSFDPWYSIEFKNEWSNPMYQETKSLSTLIINKEFYLTYVDSDTVKEQKVNNVDLTGKAPTKFSLSGFTFATIITDEDTVLDYTILKNTSITKAEITPQAASFVANKNLVEVVLVGTGTVLDNAFAYCPNLQRVTIAATVNTFGADAFLNCAAINTVKYLGKISQWCNISFTNAYSNPLFAGTPSFYCNFGTADEPQITQIANELIIDGTNVIKQFTLSNISTINSIKVNQALVQIEPQCILRCNKLRTFTATASTGSNIHIANNNVYVANKAIVLLDYENILATTEVIATGACSCGADYITNIAIPSYINTIEAGAIDKNFLTKLGTEGAQALTDEDNIENNPVFTVTLPFLGRTREDTATKYLGYTFGVLNNAIGSGLSTLTLTDDTILTSQAFSGCAELQQIILPPNLCLVESGAFSGCKQLQHKDGYLLDDKGQQRLLYKLPAGVEELTISCPVYDYAARAHAKLKKLVFSNANGTISIGLSAFEQTAIVAVETPEDLTVHINERAFYKCPEITQVKLTKVGLLGKEAFYGCTKLATLHLPANIVTTDNDTTFNITVGTRLFGACTNLKHLKIPTLLTAYITKNHVEDVEFNAGNAISAAAFRDCKFLKTVTLTSNITTIGAQAFYGCIQLRNINLSNITTIGDYAFTNCTNLYNIGTITLTLIEKLQTVKSAFTGCYKLVEINMSSPCSEELKTGASGLFDYCRSITTDGTSKIKQDDSDNNLVIFDNSVLLDYLGNALSIDLTGRNIVEIIQYAFINNDNLEQVTLDSNTTTIGEMAFYSCNNFIGLSGDLSKLTTLGNGVFSNTAIANTANVLNNSAIKSIPERAFENCSKLQTISISAQVESIASDAFNQCPNIINIEVDSGNALYTAATNENALPAVLTNNGTQVVFGCFPAQSSDKTFAFDDNVTEILEGAFRGQTASIACIKLPRNLKKIGISAFEGCLGLSAVDFSEIGSSEIKTPCIIDVNAFKDCKSITSITLPGTIQKIEAGAFMNTTNLSTLEFNDAGLELLGPKAFVGCKLTEVALPATLKTVGSFVFANNPASLVLYAPTGMSMDTNNETVLASNAWKNKWNATSITNATTYLTYTTILYDIEQG